MSLLSAFELRDPAAAERAARDATTLAERVGDADLELCAGSQLGVCLVEAGRLEEGMALLDEAMAAGLAREGERHHSPGGGRRHGVGPRPVARGRSALSMREQVNGPRPR